jgi:hypothetical protein
LPAWPARGPQPPAQAQGSLENRQNGNIFVATRGTLAGDNPTQREHANGLAFQHRNRGPPELGVERKRRAGCLDADPASFLRGFCQKDGVLQQFIVIDAARATQPKENAADTGDVGWTGCGAFHRRYFGTAAATAQSRFL